MDKTQKFTCTVAHYVWGFNNRPQIVWKTSVLYAVVFQPSGDNSDVCNYMVYSTPLTAYVYVVLYQKMLSSKAINCRLLCNDLIQLPTSSVAKQVDFSFLFHDTTLFIDFYSCPFFSLSHNSSVTVYQDKELSSPTQNTKQPNKFMFKTFIVNIILFVRLIENVCPKS